MAAKSTKRHKNVEGIRISFLCLFVFFVAVPGWLLHRARMVLRAGTRHKRNCSRAPSRAVDNATTLSSPHTPCAGIPHTECAGYCSRLASIMSLTALLPAAIPGMTVLASRAAEAVSNGLSFAATLANLGPAPAPAAVTQEEPKLPAELQQALARFAELLRERLAAMGRSLAGPVELSADVLGEIEAVGNPQDAEAVEQLLAHDEELSSQFFQLASAFQQVTGQANAASMSLPWDVAGAARGVTMIVGEDGAKLVSE